MTERLVVDASAMVDLLLGTRLGEGVAARLRRHELHVPGHFDAEVLSALGRLHRAGRLAAGEVVNRLQQLADAPIVRHQLAPIVVGAWRLRHNLRLVDALYVELASNLGDAPIITTDRSLAATVETAEVIR